MAVREQYGISIVQRSSEATRETFLATEQTRGPKANPTVVGNTSDSNGDYVHDELAEVTTTNMGLAHITAKTALINQVTAV